jgi:hypothetical protein
MKLLLTSILLLTSLSTLAQQSKDKAPAPQSPQDRSQQRPQQGPGPRPGPGRPPMDFETMKKQAVSRMEKRISILESGKNCAEGAKDGPTFGECMRKMGENHRAEDARIKAEDEKLRAEAERRGPAPQNSQQPTRFKIDEEPKTPAKVKIEEKKPEVKKK